MISRAGVRRRSQGPGELGGGAAAARVSDAGPADYQRWIRAETPALDGDACLIADQPAVGRDAGNLRLNAQLALGSLLHEVAAATAAARKARSSYIFYYGGRGCASLHV